MHNLCTTLVWNSVGERDCESMVKEDIWEICTVPSFAVDVKFLSQINLKSC